MIANLKRTEMDAEVYTLLIPGTKQVNLAEVQTYIFSWLMFNWPIWPSVNLCCKGPDNNYFRLCGPYSPGCNMKATIENR